MCLGMSDVFFIYLLICMGCIGVRVFPDQAQSTEPEVCWKDEKKNGTVLQIMTDVIVREKKAGATVIHTAALLLLYICTPSKSPVGTPRRPTSLPLPPLIVCRSPYDRLFLSASTFSFPIHLVLS